MNIERWGAFSVVDHKDARKLAADVLLYNRLLFPTPMDWGRPRWVLKGWDPDGLEKRIAEVGGDIVIRADWDLDRQKDWSAKFDALRSDQQDINSAFGRTRRVLVDQGRNYRPKGVEAIEVFAAYQSEADFQQLDYRASEAGQTSELNFLIAARLSIPDEQDPEECLKRALDLAHQQKFRARRRNFHNWQHDILSRGQIPQDAVGELTKLVGEFNEATETTGRSYRVETVVLVGLLATAALTTLAGIDPAAFSEIGVGALKGAQVMAIGGATTGALVQIARHIGGQRDPDADSLTDVSGAMFHQIEKETGWRLRTESE